MRPACEHAIDWKPGMPLVNLAGEGRQCAIFPAPAPQLKAAAGPRGSTICGPGEEWVAFNIGNFAGDGRSMWFAVYNWRNDWRGDEIRYATCIPENTRVVMCLDPQRMNFLAEVKKRGAGCGGPNQAEAWAKDVRPASQRYAPRMGYFWDMLCADAAANCRWRETKTP